MYVLADLEWITNRHGNHSITQLAAIRVDENWDTVDSFSTLFRPKDASFEQWGHMAFNGWQRQDFEAAGGSRQGLIAFATWLKPTDILCWWHKESSTTLDFFMKIACVYIPVSKEICLGDYVLGFLAGQKNAVGNPYKLCASRSISVPETMHCSQNDVLAMQSLVKGIGFDQQHLTQPPKKWTKEATALKGSTAYDYLYDPRTGLLHRSDCVELPDTRYLPGYTSFKTPLKKQYKPCACCKAEYNQALRERATDIVERTEYNYLYVKDSGVFHTRSCKHVLMSYEILGTISYEAVKKTGRRPCKHCNPGPLTRKIIEPTKKAKKCQQIGNRDLAGEERKALGRYKRAKEEREMIQKRPDLTDAERNKLMSLSQPGLAFWASQGYSTFHRRNCSKIAGLPQLKGFSRYQDAVHAGYSPCRLCKPSPKQDVQFSIPISNKERKGETADVLNVLCAAHGIPYHYDGKYFSLQTEAGKWRIDTTLLPVRLEHINLIHNFGDTTKYHVQPRLFLSFKDTFDYILRHDRNLMAELNEPLQEAELMMG